ncbi:MULTISPECIES: alpha/beta hydrolase [Rhizobium]|uniref:Alpha/beta hydrolase family protein n=1 Tax=Rhizobium phaseoli TaxID=396 RepID=A0ABN4QYN4_9HYPH|nr:MULTISPECIES: alpha/beta hydrolase [Rhizobium]ANL50181.1 alpha/beta hydrolase family protein [Rhizobium phaseoli]ANL88302.1 alpha/beta hydrolase family protein [Rhizobium phaseoli]ANL94811.1 alpha/beta hydrolase family protein [Rhizobium phaseoli]MDE8757760.1 alpha/beta hydrolase [Rhizobium sp. CBK13]
MKKAAPATAPGLCLLPVTRRESGRARRLNALLRLLPRYHTNRRWNAKTVQAAVRTAQFLLSDGLIGRGEVACRTILIDGRRLRLRLLFPAGSRRGLYVHFHGGAWVMGNARLDDGITRPIAAECGMMVAGVDFHNAIDDRLDITLQDCKAAVEWVVEHLGELQVERIIIGGESSGAHLAAEALLHLRERGRADAVAGFVSVCGAFDLTGSDSLRRSTGTSLIIDGPAALHNLRRLTRSLSGREAEGPLSADLSGLPPALLIAGALDPIVDDSLSMARQWQEQSGNAGCVVVPDAPHGFNRLPTKLAAKANALVREWILRTLAPLDG